MMVHNHSRRDSVIVVYDDGTKYPRVLQLYPGAKVELSGEVLGTYKVTRSSRLVDDPSVVEVEE